MGICAGFPERKLFSCLSGSLHQDTSTYTGLLLECYQQLYYKVKRGNSNRILTPGVIPIPECRASFIKVTKLKTAMRTCIASLLTYTNHWLTPQYAGDISVTVGIAPPSE